MINRMKYACIVFYSKDKQHVYLSCNYRQKELKTVDAPFVPYSCFEYGVSNIRYKDERLLETVKPLVEIFDSKKRQSIQ